MYWRKNPNMDAIRLMGCWASEKTIPIHTQDGLSHLVETQFSVSEAPLRNVYRSYSRQDSSLRNSRGRGSGAHVMSTNEFQSDSTPILSDQGSGE